MPQNLRSSCSPHALGRRPWSGEKVWKSGEKRLFTTFYHTPRRPCIEPGLPMWSVKGHVQGDFVWRSRALSNGQNRACNFQRVKFWLSSVPWRNFQSLALPVKAFASSRFFPPFVSSPFLSARGNKEHGDILKQIHFLLNVSNVFILVVSVSLSLALQQTFPLGITSFSLKRSKRQHSTLPYHFSTLFFKQNRSVSWCFNCETVNSGVLGVSGDLPSLSRAGTYSMVVPGLGSLAASLLRKKFIFVCIENLYFLCTHKESEKSKDASGIQFWEWKDVESEHCRMHAWSCMCTREAKDRWPQL